MENTPERSGGIRKLIVALLFAFVISFGCIIAIDQFRPDVLKALAKAKDDASPLPNYRGNFTSIGLAGNWHSGDGVKERIGFLMANANGAPDVSPPPSQVPATRPPGGLVAPPANCSTGALVFYASQAPYEFEPTKKGLLYGVRTHTSATKVEDMPGYNSCALVAHAILKKAGCKWSKYTASAKEIYDQAWKAGWRPSTVQKAGCIVAWNSVEEGWRPRIGKGSHVDKTKKKGVKFRHVGITTGDWMAVDNTSVFSRPTPGLTYRPIRYESPIFLCPVAQPKSNQSAEK